MVYELIRKTMPGSKLQIFQFELLYKILATNRMLYIWGGIQSSQLCRFCCKEAETLDHLFWCCPLCSSFLVTGSGMAEELQNLPRTNVVNTNTG
jgi:hypothetical protein